MTRFCSTLMEAGSCVNILPVSWRSYATRVSERPVIACAAGDCTCSELAVQIDGGSALSELWLRSRNCKVAVQGSISRRKWVAKVAY